MGTVSLDSILVVKDSPLIMRCENPCKSPHIGIGSNLFHCLVKIDFGIRKPSNIKWDLSILHENGSSINEQTMRCEITLVNPMYCYRQKLVLFAGCQVES